MPCSISSALIASLDEIAETANFMQGAKYFLVKNFINNTSFFEWDQATYNSDFHRIKDATELTIPKLNEMAYEQVEVASVPFLKFVANKGVHDEAANYSFVLRGYVRHWLAAVWSEFDRIKLTDIVGSKEKPPAAAAARNSNPVIPGRASGASPEIHKPPRRRWIPGCAHYSDAQPSGMTTSDLTGFATSSDIGPMRRTPVYIICSPRPLVGKTLIARLLSEFLLLQRGSVVAFDINLKEPSLLDYLPKLTETADVIDTFGKMQ